MERNKMSITDGQLIDLFTAVVFYKNALNQNDMKSPEQDELVELILEDAEARGIGKILKDGAKKIMDSYPIKSE